LRREHHPKGERNSEKNKWAIGSTAKADKGLK
jgi:hypothetical protein